MLCTDPRSTVIHCGSLKALDQRVPVLPSTAAAGGKAPAFSLDEVVTGRFSARLAVCAAVPRAPTIIEPSSVQQNKTSTAPRNRRDGPWLDTEPISSDSIVPPV